MNASSLASKFRQVLAYAALVVAFLQSQSTIHASPIFTAVLGVGAFAILTVEHALNGNQPPQLPVGPPPVPTATVAPPAPYQAAQQPQTAA